MHNVVNASVENSPLRAKARRSQHVSHGLEQNGCEPAVHLVHLMSLVDQVNAEMAAFTTAMPVNQFREIH